METWTANKQKLKLTDVNILDYKLFIKELNLLPDFFNYKEIEDNIIFNYYQKGMGIYLNIDNIERLNLETITGAITEIKDLENEFLTKSK